MRPSDRTLRFSGHVTTDELAQQRVLIAGCGAIGKQVATQCAMMGVGTLYLTDHDMVEKENLGTQGWSPSQIGVPKPTALAATLAALNPECVIHPLHMKAEVALVSIPHPTFAFLCVDTMGARKEIANALKCPFADTRVGFATVRVLAFSDPVEYQKTLYSSAEVAPTRCDMRLLPSTAFIAAGWAVWLWLEYMKGHPIQHDLVQSLPAMELLRLTEPPPTQVPTPQCVAG